MIRAPSRACVVCAGFLLGCAAPAPELGIELERGGGERASFAVVGLDAASLAALGRKARTDRQWRELFAVALAGEEPSPVPGRHEVSRGALRFVPRFPLDAGLTYLARFDGTLLPTPRGRPVVERSFVVEASAVAERTTVEAFYPSAGRLVENTLRFYLHFSAPMRQGGVYRHLRLVRDDGVEVQHPFLEIDEELWDPGGTRLTLLCDPGRVKHGLRPRQEDGPILEQGRSYTLMVDDGWRDARGHPLGSRFSRKFAVIAPDNRQLDPKRWTLGVPAAGTREPLLVRFPRGLDHALLHRMLWVEGAAGAVEGDVSVGGSETEWRLRPGAPWAGGAYRLVADTELEDPSGNSIRSAFEVDTFGRGRSRPEVETTSLAFTVR